MRLKQMNFYVLALAVLAIPLFATNVKADAAPPTNPVQQPTKVTKATQPSLHVNNALTMYVSKGDSQNSSRGYFQSEITPGQEGNYTVTIENISNHEASGILYVSDMACAINGGRNLFEPDHINSEGGTWFEQKPQRMTLLPHTKQDVTFHARFPLGLPSGQYFVMLGLLNDDGKDGDPTKQSGFKVEAAQRTAIQVVMNNNMKAGVDFVEPGSEIKHYASDGTTHIQVPLVNKGTLPEKVTAHLQILDSSNKVIVDAPDLKTDNIYTATTATLDFEIDQKILSSGSYKAKLTGEYANSLTFEKLYDFTVQKDEAKAALRSTQLSGNQVTAVGSADSVSPDKLIIYSAASTILLTGLFFFLVYRSKRRNSKEMQRVSPDQS